MDPFLFFEIVSIGAVTALIAYLLINHKLKMRDVCVLIYYATEALEESKPKDAQKIRAIASPMCASIFTALERGKGIGTSEKKPEQTDDLADRIKKRLDEATNGKDRVGGG